MVRLLGTLLVVLITLSGCASVGGQEKQVDERGMRTDLDPLTSRFPAIGEPVSASWMSGTLGDRDAPGPSSYWIDGVVTLAPDTAERLRAEHAPAPGGDGPDLVEEVARLVPDAELTRSDALDAAVSHDGWAVRAWLVTGEDVLVLEAKGE